MIELEFNGKPEPIEAASIDELEQAIQRPLPPDHAVYKILIDGKQMAPNELSPHELTRIRRVCVESAPLAEIAERSVDETIEWIGRICGVLDSIANDYRLGRDREATGRLPSVADALQVLVHLLYHIHAHLPIDSHRFPNFKSDWESAELELRDGIDGLAADLGLGDQIRLADRVGYTIPKSLKRFPELLEAVRH